MEGRRRWQLAMTLAAPLMVALLLRLAPAAQGAPAQADFSDCKRLPYHEQFPLGLTVNCCHLEALMRKPEPLYKTWQLYLEENPLPKRLRVRPAAHLVADNKTYIEQLDRAYRLIKALPDSDPRSLFQQNNFHCMYGDDGAIHQAGLPDLGYLIHRNWFFFPFHRWFTFFYEKILAKLVGDEDFVLPFWNWDNQTPSYPNDPNTIPAYYRDPDNYPGLFNKWRDPKHRPGAKPVPVNLLKTEVQRGIQGGVKETRVANNAHLRSVIVDSTANGEKTPFLSTPFRSGDLQVDQTKMNATFEGQAHTAIHLWVGDKNYMFAEMGNSYHALRDPLFFAHHANVDRMWDVWLGLEGRSNFDDPDWLDAAFYFYNEHAEIVRVTVADCLNAENLNYRYQEVPNPWVDYDPSNTANLATMGDASTSAHFQA